MNAALSNNKYTKNGALLQNRTEMNHGRSVLINNLQAAQIAVESLGDEEARDNLYDGYIDEGLETDEVAGETLVFRGLDGDNPRGGDYVRMARLDSLRAHTMAEKRHVPLLKFDDVYQPGQIYARKFLRPGGSIGDPAFWDWVRGADLPIYGDPEILVNCLALDDNVFNILTLKHAPHGEFDFSGGSALPHVITNIKTNKYGHVEQVYDGTVQSLTPGAGITGSAYNGLNARTWSLDFGTGHEQAARGDHYHANHTPGAGISGSAYNGSGAQTWSLDFGSGQNQAARGNHNHDAVYLKISEYTPCSCEDGGGGGGEGGLTIGQGDARWVKKTGDTMTGKLTIASGGLDVGTSGNRRAQMDGDLIYLRGNRSEMGTNDTYGDFKTLMLSRSSVWFFTGGIVVGSIVAPVVPVLGWSISQGAQTARRGLISQARVPVTPPLYCG